MINSRLREYCDSFTINYDSIPDERKKLLLQISAYISEKHSVNKTASLVYICTHNSRRSHFGQIWAAVAARYYGIENVKTFSGGTEATAFNINAINALRKIGFDIDALNDDNNAVYRVSFDNVNSIECFSKVFDHPVNPKSDFAAIMTCSEAEQNCPFIPGADVRVGITYDDPKAFDGTDLQEQKYLERCLQIATETFYVFSNVKR